MRTTKPISTISYNSEEFLTARLNELVEQEKVAFWCYVKHVGELLDNGKEQVQEKDHIHLFIEPNTLLDTVSLQKFTEEFVPDCEKPLKCIYFRSSDWVNWLWYDLHDDDYLASKMEERQYAYTLEDFKSSDIDEFIERSTQALHDSQIFADMKLKRMLKTHTVSEMVFMGMIKPFQAAQYYQYERLYRLGASGSDRVDGEYERRRQLAEEIALDTPIITGNHE